MASTEITAETQTKEKAGDESFETGNWMLDALLRPGSSTSKGTLSFLDKVFYLLFASIFFLMWMTDFTNIHTYVFIFLAFGLFFSVRFFVSELKKAQAEGKLGGEDDEEERKRQQEQEEMKRQLEQEEEKRRREQVKIMEETRKDR